MEILLLEGSVTSGFKSSDQQTIIGVTKKVKYELADEILV